MGWISGDGIELKKWSCTRPGESEKNPHRCPNVRASHPSYIEVAFSQTQYPANLQDSTGSSASFSSSFLASWSPLAMFLQGSSSATIALPVSPPTFLVIPTRDFTSASIWTSGRKTDAGAGAGAGSGSGPGMNDSIGVQDADAGANSISGPSLAAPNVVGRDVAGS
ncbi:hypothetical protein D9758_009089 [Tetrapyrgos nigripes]|uniref:Uncharacterized protein n=1 Tax=Tetrapyrgos nigripes TaxID=182062 RepID=A0A8H5LL44_9AGAR|nr:hypothetical protein D9758_009089 [Tetrapyrgos nigripes]